MGNAVRKRINLSENQRIFDEYDPPKREGNSPFTRSGVPPPKMGLKSGSSSPSHRIYDPMSLELHMADERVRARGLSPAEREYRHQYLKDQHLHPDEPVHVDAVHRQLNPVRRLYRWPMDTLYVRFLRPNFGTLYGSVIRVFVPKLFMTIIFMQTIYYIWKYENKSWHKKWGIGSYRQPLKIVNYDEVNDAHPGLFAKALPDIGADDRYFQQDYKNRGAFLGDKLGETSRPW